MKKGFTLIEMTVTIVLMGIISSVIALYIREGVDAWNYTKGHKGLAMSGRAAMTRIVKEIRRADENTNITVFTSSEISFQDIDGATITYSQEGTCLYRNADIMLDDLLDPGGLSLTYLDKDGNVTAEARGISAVRCRLRLLNGRHRLVLESAARIRTRRLK